MNFTHARAPPPTSFQNFKVCLTQHGFKSRQKKSKTKKRNWIPQFRSCLCFVFEKRIPNRDSRRILFSRFLSSRVMSGKKKHSSSRQREGGGEEKEEEKRENTTNKAAASNKQSVGGVEEFKNASSVQAPQALLINNGVKKTFLHS